MSDCIPAWEDMSFKYYRNITSDKDAQNATDCRVHLHLFYLCWDIRIVLLLLFIWLEKFLHIHANLKQVPWSDLWCKFFSFFKPFMQAFH